MFRDAIIIDTVGKSQIKLAINQGMSGSPLATATTVTRVATPRVHPNAAFTMVGRFSLLHKYVKHMSSIVPTKIKVVLSARLFISVSRPTIKRPILANTKNVCIAQNVKFIFLSLVAIGAAKRFSVCFAADGNKRH